MFSSKKSKKSKDKSGRKESSSKHDRKHHEDDQAGSNRGQKLERDDYDDERPADGTSNNTRKSNPRVDPNPEPKPRPKPRPSNRLKSSSSRTTTQPSTTRDDYDSNDEEKYEDWNSDDMVVYSTEITSLTAGQPSYHVSYAQESNRLPSSGIPYQPRSTQTNPGYQPGQVEQSAYTVQSQYQTQAYRPQDTPSGGYQVNFQTTPAFVTPTSGSGHRRHNSDDDESWDEPN